MKKKIAWLSGVYSSNIICHINIKEKNRHKKLTKLNILIKNFQQTRNRIPPLDKVHLWKSNS